MGDSFAASNSQSATVTVCHFQTVAVQNRRSGSVDTADCHLSATIILKSLYQEWHLINDAINKIKGIVGGTT